jgi:hypothetical protein
LVILFACSPERSTAVDVEAELLSNKDCVISEIEQAHYETSDQNAITTAINAAIPLGAGGFSVGILTADTLKILITKYKNPNILAGTLVNRIAGCLENRRNMMMDRPEFKALPNETRLKYLQESHAIVEKMRMDAAAIIGRPEVVSTQPSLATDRVTSGRAHAELLQALVRVRMPKPSVFVNNKMQYPADVLLDEWSKVEEAYTDIDDILVRHSQALAGINKDVYKLQHYPGNLHFRNNVDTYNRDSTPKEFDLEVWGRGLNKMAKAVFVSAAHKYLELMPSGMTPKQPDEWKWQ